MRAFPAGWIGSVEVKIVQPVVFCAEESPESKPESDYSSELESPVIEIKLPFTEAAAQK
jgi:hypothetical protein